MPTTPPTPDLQSEPSVLSSGVGRFYLGCAVWAFKGWVGSFYPKGSRPATFLKLYGDRLNTVEGNTTFYSVPDEATILRWRDTMPPGFQFCPKLPRTVSHQGALMPRLTEALAFLDGVTPLGDRLGPLLLQLPPSYAPDRLPDLEEFLTEWPTKTAPIGVEVRHPNWYKAPHPRYLDRLLARQSVSRVLLDTRPIYSGDDDPQAQSQRKKPKLPLHPRVTNSQAIIRLICHPEGERNLPYWQEWANRITVWLHQGIDIYCYMHCPEEEHSPHFARQLQALLEEQNAPIPPLAWNELIEDQQAITQPDDEAQQLSLF